MKRNITLWVIQGLLAALFLFAGSMKLVLPIEAMAGPVSLPMAPATSATPMKRRNQPGSDTGPAMASMGRTSFIEPANRNRAASSP